MADIIKNLSLRLYDILEQIGASERIRRLHRTSATMEEILLTTQATSFHQMPLCVYKVGSYYEGSVTPALSSGVDMIYCRDKIALVLDPQDAPVGNAFLVLREDSTYPGYVKLQAIANRRPADIHSTNAIFHCIVDEAGKMCLSNAALNRLSGPAIAFTDYAGQLTDYVGAFRCNVIPAFCNEWLIRQRNYEWPSERDLTEMSRLGCFVVGTGYDASSERNIEWRLSFSLQERLLMSQLNPVQHKVYILLKMVMKDFIDDVLGSSITSYHCKMCLFYAIENSPRSSWRRDSLFNCLVLCMSILLTWIDNGFCPSYFAKGQNLFAKKKFLAVKTPVRKVVKRVLQSEFRFLFDLHTDHVGQMLTETGFRLYSRVAEDNAKVHEFKVKWNTIRSNSSRYFVDSKPYSPESLYHLLDDLNKTECTTGHTLAETRKALSYKRTWVHLHLALSRAAMMLSIPDPATLRQTVKEIDHHFHKARNADLMGSRLGMATVLYRLRKYEDCSRLLQLVENDLTTYVMTRCSCSQENMQTQFKRQMLMKTSGFSIKKTIRTSIASCVVFLPSEKEITPVALKQEMNRSVDTPAGSRDERFDFWFDWAVVDAKVYLFFLKYLVYAKLQRQIPKRVAIENILWVIRDDPNLGHKDTAYNILGWIYLQEKQTQESIRCFTESIKIRPFHNAAKIHLRHTFG